MRKLLAVLILAAFSTPAFAQGASVTFTLSINSPPSTAVTITGVGPCSGSGSSTVTLSCGTSAIAANTEFATIAVAPSGWTGGMALGSLTGSATSSSFVVGGASPNYTLSAGSAGLAIGFSGGATLTASP